MREKEDRKPEILRIKTSDSPSEEEAITDLEWLQIASDEKIFLEEKRRAIAELSKIVTRCASSLEAYMITLSNMKVIADQLEEQREVIEENESCIAELVVKIYDKFCEAHLVAGARKDNLDDRKKSSCSIPFSHVDVCFLENCFVVKTGRLLSRNMSLYKRNAAHPIYRNMHLFQEEVRAILSENQEKIPKFKAKHIIVLSVYHEKNGPIIDNDNLEIKGIVDAIGQFTGGDDAMTTSFSLFTLVEKGIKAGTYFIVAGGKESPLDLSESQQILQKCFSN